ncbi:unnamed protein product [Soboliphyme baturini]|uniref:Uncharacterized protein n=1 Tax=Soboliphyme baturini TaxID=241478 RepID=A0A183IFL1_9BILA|nr:unnamed protein product [Soboliphyme baturini]
MDDKSKKPMLRPKPQHLMRSNVVVDHAVAAPAVTPAAAGHDECSPPSPVRLRAAKNGHVNGIYDPHKAVQRSMVTLAETEASENLDGKCAARKAAVVWSSSPRP